MVDTSNRSLYLTWPLMFRDLSFHQVPLARFAPSVLDDAKACQTFQGVTRLWADISVWQGLQQLRYRLLLGVFCPFWGGCHWSQLHWSQPWRAEPAERGVAHRFVLRRFLWRAISLPNIYAPILTTYLCSMNSEHLTLWIIWWWVKITNKNSLDSFCTSNIVSNQQMFAGFPSLSFYKAIGLSLEFSPGQRMILAGDGLVLQTLARYLGLRGEKRPFFFRWAGWQWLEQKVDFCFLMGPKWIAVKDKSESNMDDVGVPLF